MARRKSTKTRAELISLLKSRGVRGRLSKLTKSALLAKVEETAPPATHDEEQEGNGPATAASGLSLEEDTQKGGHRYNMKGSTTAKEKAKYGHEHIKSSWPATSKRSERSQKRRQ